MTIKQRILEIDLLGALFLICAIVCLLLALQWGGTTYPWKNSKIWGLFLAFGLLIIVFIALQIRRGDRATIPPRILKQRTVWSACAFSCFLSMALYVSRASSLCATFTDHSLRCTFSTFHFTFKLSKEQLLKVPESVLSRISPRSSSPPSQSVPPSVIGAGTNPSWSRQE